MSADRTTSPRPRRGQDVRPIGPREHYSGIAILALVMLLCTWVLVRGLAPRGVLWGAYDPSLFAGPAATAPAGSSPVEAGADPGEDQGGAPAPAGGGDDHGGSAAVPASGPAPGAQALPVAAPAGWTAGAVETFDPVTLSNKIDGRAEAYLAYGFQRLETVSLKQGEETCDLFVFDMATPLQCFGMFGSERSGGEPTVSIGEDSYRSGASLYFRQQQYYVQVVGTSEADAAAAARLAVAQAIAAKLPSGRSEFVGVGWFPPQNLKSGGIGYVIKGALGQPWLGDVWTARYQIKDTELMAFIAQRTDPAAAKADCAKYAEFLKTSGKLSGKAVQGVTLQVADQNGMYDVIAQVGRYFLGVSYTDQRAAAEALVVSIAKGLPQ
ncbi:MAG: hypothetical protein IT204_09735 [Fimbriimonadaceae bacterium]|nr:hypothetical protein [Fimbriimonadaceae bacterium]